MTTYLVVEGDAGAPLLERLLPSEIQSEVTIIVSGERSTLASKARTLLLTRRRPVAVVANAGAIDKGAIRQRFQILDELVDAAAAGVPYKVVLAVPEIESWYFAVPEFLERLSGKTLSPDQRELGELRPKEMLRRLFTDQASPLIDNLASELTEPEIKLLRETQPRKELIEFLTEQVQRKTELQPV